MHAWARWLGIILGLIFLGDVHAACLETCAIEVSQLKKTGVLARLKGQPHAAIASLLKAYQLNPDPELAIQLAYAYHDLKLDKLAIHYFNLVTQSGESPVALRAENALTRLVGQQTQAFSKPYFGEWFALPTTQSRFKGLTVTESIGRIGVQLPDTWKSKEYFFLRRTEDNRSKSFFELSEVYEDNVQITGIGVQASPIPGFPLLVFGEMGAAYDLLYQQRQHWRSDFRAGVAYFQLFGIQPAYFYHVRIKPDYYSFIYADATYFSRYQNNVIGVLRTHQGIHLLQYHSTILNVYIRGMASEDSQRVFSNNFAEIGPGLGLIPSNRWNLEFRLDFIEGMYLPAGRDHNPYGKYYTNTLIQALFYVRV